jgi:hypothetical protein
MDLMSILNQAGGVGAIAQHLGVDEATVEQGAGALLPHVVNGVETQGLPAGAEAQAADPAAPADGGGLGGLLGGGGLGGMLGGLMGGDGGGGILGSLIGGGVGNQVLGHIFGSKDVSSDVAAQASQQSGVDPSILKKLLPIVAGAVAMHYMTRGNSATAQSGGDGQSGSGGILGSILGGLGR